MKSLFKFKDQYTSIIFYLLFGVWIFFNFFWFFYDSTLKFSEHQLDYNGHIQDGARLRKIVKRASMADNRVIVTILETKSKTNRSFFDVFLKGFKLGHGIEGLLNHIVVFTEDFATYKHCKSRHPHCFNLATYETNSTWGALNNHNHSRLGWKTVDVVGEIIDLGYSLLFTEIDVLWLRNPFPHLNVTTDITTGRESAHKMVSDLGFFYLNCNERTFQFLKYWKMSSVLYPNITHKSVFEIIKEDSEAEMIGLRLDYLDTRIFGGISCESTLYSNTICALHVKCYKRNIDSRRKIVDFIKKNSSPQIG